jgi:hypothetical protein
VGKNGVKWPVLRYEEGGMAVHKMHVLLDELGFYSGGAMGQQGDGSP